MQTSSSIRILVVDDEAEIRELLRKLFEREGFQVCEAGNGEELFDQLERGAFDLITLDLSLPRADGLTLARQLRAISNVPIIIISGKDDTIDRVVGLEIGADDYIPKPFHLREVLARVRAVLRRRNENPPVVLQPTGAPEADECYRFVGHSLDVRARRFVRADGAAVELTTAEFDMLLIFLRRPGRVLSRDVLMDLLKGHDWSPLDRTIDNLVGRVRRKLGDDGDAPQLIKTVRSVGYVFAGAVTRA